MVEIGLKMGNDREVWVRPAALDEYLAGFRNRAENTQSRQSRRTRPKNPKRRKQNLWSPVLEPANYDLGQVERETSTSATEIRAELLFAAALYDILESTDRRDKTFSNICQLVEARLGAGPVSPRRVRRALKLLGFGYNVSHRTYKTTTEQRRATFFALASIFRELNLNQQNLFYFDTTTFSFETIPRRSWQSPTCRTWFAGNSNYKRYHLLMVMGRDKVVAWQVLVGSVTTIVISSFLMSVLGAIREAHPSRVPVLLLDNCKLHKTELAKRLAESNLAVFTFTGPHSPFINPIEEAFRFLKGPARRTHFLNE
jgi:hypothetical protein